MVRATFARSLRLLPVLLAPLAVACGQGSAHTGLASGGSDGSGGGRDIPPVTNCTTPQLGCACDTEAEVVECGDAVRHSEGYTACSMGTRTCENGKWGTCEGAKIAMLPDDAPGAQTQALGTSQACVDNPCDPYCQVIVDDSKNLDVTATPGLTSGNNGLSLTIVPPDPMAANPCTGIKVTPATQTLTVTAINPTTGLLGEYFNRFDKTIASIPATWVVTGTRVDSSVGFDWGSGAPGVTGIGVDGFTVRWTGSVTAPATGAYTFYTRSDDGARLWVNGTLMVNQWVDQGPTEVASTPITLTQGVPVSIKMEYYENGGGATAQLEWSSAAITKQIIPETFFTPPNSALPPFVVSPANAPLVVSVVPPTCYAGTVTAAWSLDKLDRATVSSAGLVSLVSPLAGSLAATAYVQQFKDTATINVVVNATDVLEAPTGAPAKFAGASTGADTTTILYPYDATVLPVALKPPVLQWDTGGVAADSVKVSLTYPAASPTFSWSKIVASPANSRFTFTRDQWGFFERTAKGGTGKITLQRVVGGNLKDAISKTVTFASTPLRGRIFYTQYGGGSDIMRLDPGGDIAAVKAFPNVNGCPVCHSMSADGSKFATSHYGFSTNGGISNVDATGTLNVLSDFQNPSSPYSDGGNDWRGFAWAPLTPDGKYIFATNNIYGNTRQAVVGIDTTTRNVLPPTAMVSGGRGTGLMADYYSNTLFTGNSWRRIDAQPTFDWLASPGGPVPATGYSVVWNGFVEGYYSEPYTFEVETGSGVRLTVGGTVVIDQLLNNTGLSFNKITGSTTVNLTRGAQTAIKLELINKNVETFIKLRWQSARTPYQRIPQSMLYPTGGQHGAQVYFHDNSGHSITRLESELYGDWGGGQPVKGSSDATQNIDADNFTSTWDAVVEAPATDNLTFCINSDDGYTVKVTTPANVTTTVLTGTACTCNVYTCSTTPIAVTAGDKLKVHVDHFDNTGGARMLLGWKTSSFITATEPIPSARTFPPSTWAAPTTGLSATFYDTMDFGSAKVATNATTPQGFSTYVPNLDYDWGGDRYSYGLGLTDSDTMSGRFTGRIQPSCTGITEFEIYADDTTNVWIGGERLLQQTSWGTKYAARWLDKTQFYDFKVDWTEDGGGAGIRINWKPCGVGSFVAVPQANFRPTGDTTLNGYLQTGGDNGNGYPYVAWQTPTTVGSPPVDVTSQSAGNWGLGQSVMMVPTFAPDASKLVFVDGDSATNAGWRKGLSTFDFDQANKLFKNRRQLVNNFPAGDVIKWPTYESDSKSVIYQTTTPGDMCCRNSWTLYGYMGPTNYFEDPGKLWSVDSTAAAPTPVALAKLNNGERNIDRNKAYQATMLPTAAGGYRWTVFTSTRPYGNTINLPATQQDYTNTANNGYTPELNTGEIQTMLWVSAIDDSVSAAADRSHPAFFLPNQAYSESGGHYLNERAYWVTEACRPAGSSAGSSCDVDEDCCGGTASPKTGLCRIDTPITQPPTRHCAAVPPTNSCFAAGAACTVNSDCCFGNPCVANICTQPPPLPTYTPANFKRVYTAECGKGTKPIWRFFDWQATTPPTGSSIDIYAESVDDPLTFHTVPVAPTAVAISGVVKIATISGATVTGWVGQDVGALLTAANLPQRKYLQITVRLSPSNNNTATPVMTDWRQAYSCPPQE